MTLVCVLYQGVSQDAAHKISDLNTGSAAAPAMQVKGSIPWPAR